jgi:colanic acid biosynthesis glycosyl transferase WcaI
VPLRRGLGHVSVPSKTYTILAAGRPVVAAIDTDTEVSRIVTRAGCGVVVAPDDTPAFIEAIRAVLSTVDLGAGMGRAGRAWVESSASPSATAAAYETLVRRVKATG